MRVDIWDSARKGRGLVGEQVQYEVVGGHSDAVGLKMMRARR